MDVKYLLSGREVVVKQEVDGGFIVSELLECYPYGEEEPGYEEGEPKFVEKVFDKPPTAKYEEKISQLLADAAKISDEISEKREEVRAENLKIQTMRNDRTIVDQELAQFSILSELRNMLTGRITHLFKHAEYYRTPEILSAEDHPKKYHSKGILMQLKFNDGGDFKELEKALFWSARYDDHDYDKTTPCTSYEQAVGLMQDEILAYAPKSVSRKWLALANEYSVELPENYEGIIFEKESADLNDKIEKAEKELAKQKEMLEKLNQPNQ